ncbi:spondin domain-containing protein [Pseudoalteromonas sp. MMG012]|uniref:spondin domain-containing protein n=1 Tax=Pseudoalteromonas sp. MMG012 TaxID=2822686 RepID=UPI001B39D1EF|nr:spondin domain-containing protein [Pseudoalteromonas sp. MMG012]MBQ4851421.1 spondin domain-containing protein [Pseudoalteromonas sp. MMG012]
MKAKLLSLVCTSSLLAMSAAQAAAVDVKITNLTQGIYFTPILIGAHTSDAHLFQTGQAASEGLQAMAEGGSIEALSTTLDSINADKLANPAGGLLAPASSAMGSLTTAENNTSLSIVAMMLPTNDGFIGLDGWKIPTEAGTYHIYLNAYDAGTEANNELVVEGSGAPGTPGIPASPGVAPGTQGAGVTDVEGNSMIHIHRGNVGDDEAVGGKSDLHNTVHRWLNPVAKVTVTVK